jgi:hypothetical protein
VLVDLLVRIVALLILATVHTGASLPRVAPLGAPPGPVAAAECDRWAAPPGRRVTARRRASEHRRRRPGNRARPLRSVPALANSLRNGETGCLLPGHYRFGDPAMLRRPRSRLVGIGGGVHVDGAIWVTARARGAQVRGLDLTASDPTYFIPLKVQADDALVAEDRIRGSRSTSCVLVGSTRRAVGVRIEGNWIHDCGRRGKLDHLIYLEQTRGAIVRGNVLTRNPGGWAVQMYPNADRSRIERNLIDGNRGGVIFAGEDGETSDYNVVRWNVISFSGPRWNIESSWAEGAGRGNVALENCLYATRPLDPSGIGHRVGFDAYDNLVLDHSPYAIRRPHRYLFAGPSECEQLVEPPPAVFPGH